MAHEAKFTPGPWTMRPAPYGFDIFVSDEATDRALWVGSTTTPLGRESPFYPPKEQVEPNAALMTAAPDLYEALRTTAGNIRSLGPAGALDVVPSPYCEWLAVVEAALAKAAGVFSTPEGG